MTLKIKRIHLRDVDRSGARSERGSGEEALRERLMLPRVTRRCCVQRAVHVCHGNAVHCAHCGKRARELAEAAWGYQ